MTATLPIFFDPNGDAWKEEGLCRYIDIDLFFPEKGGSTREAKAICRQCPVQAECLEDALKWEEPHGIRGGLSERERRPLLRARKEGL